MDGSLLFSIGKLIVVAGFVLVVVGALVMTASRLGFLGGMGSLPGDIAYKGKHVSFYFPIVTCLVLSVVVTFVLWVVSMIRRP
ncbi:MAG TPA: DUF2905 domain-containing protein [Terriglobia bacterium]|nr:DUF2905 domain-containing protein [Terriglobia bacterium]